MKLYRRTLIISEIGETVVIHAYPSGIGCLFVCLIFLVSLVLAVDRVIDKTLFGRLISTRDSRRCILQRIVHRVQYIRRHDARNCFPRRMCLTRTTQGCRLNK